MAWQDELTEQERRSLADSEAARDAAADGHKAVRRKLKSRADARTWRRKQKAASDLPPSAGAACGK